MKLDDKARIAFQVIDTWLDYQSRYEDLPGFQVCVRKKGQLIFSKAYGHANLKTQRKLTTTDLFHIASHSKTFTSCAILQLVEQGKLTLEHKAITYIPELKNHKDKRFKEITIRDLLSNRSGLFRDGIDCEFWELQKPFLSKEEMIQEVLATDLVYAPNMHTKYSNMGFALLGLIIENVMGMSYQKAMETLIFNQLKRPNIHTDYIEKFKDHCTEGHSRPLPGKKGVPLIHAPARALAAATGFCANAEDTSLFFDHVLLGEGLLKTNMQQELRSLNWPVKNSSNERYGLGLKFDKYPDMQLVGHTGGYPGFATKTVHWEGTDYIFSFFLNVANSVPYDGVKSMIQIIKMIDQTFTHKEAKEIKVTGPLMSGWDDLIFVITKKKALCFIIDTWEPYKRSLLLTSKNGEVYTCDQQNGFINPGEPITFKKDKAGNVISIKWGSSTFSQEKDFLKRLKNMVM